VRGRVAGRSDVKDNNADAMPRCSAGEKGVVKAVRILRNEIETGMRLLGVTSLDQLRPEMVERVPYAEIPSGPYRSRSE
jgi:hypothetical protein